ncbi:cysteine synthase CysM [Candidatus Persebacteraceae bacterium Df01]|jgi:cysteine synthase B|uniref:Cysteine synthase n=1 Tax=Candidatus Doriopsillibacter californiensis TaxID=2970740 RepID=A0ABT7QL70_9GAMM|nr:cysteine synthase CysM [Candidatus Persebacteraceae bacterium Df01]
MAQTEKSLADFVGNTPLVVLSRLGRQNNNRIFLKLEGNNPAGSVKDRPATNMIINALRRGDIRPGDQLVEATSGNTGIALAMAAAVLGCRMTLIMPANQTEERKQAMRAYGAELILVSKEEGIEGARDMAQEMMARGEGFLLNQFANPDNPDAHYRGTAPEIWRDTGGRITHFVSSMGTTGSIMGCARFFKEQSPSVQIIGVQPAEGAQIPGIRKWSEAYLPKIYDARRVDRIIQVTQPNAETTMRRVAREEGVFCGVSSGGALWAALQLADELQNACIVSIACDRGDRYLSSGVFT